MSVLFAEEGIKAMIDAAIFKMETTETGRRLLREFKIDTAFSLYFDKNKNGFENAARILAGKRFISFRYLDDDGRDIEEVKQK